jgi:hypothetical protein
MKPRDVLVCFREDNKHIFKSLVFIPYILCKSLLLTLQYSILETAIFNPAERERERAGEEDRKKRERFVW